MKLQERLAVIGGQLRNTQMEKVLKKLSPGEAQVDFGNMTVAKSENTECFLEGLKQLFHQAGEFQPIYELIT